MTPSERRVSDSTQPAARIRPIAVAILERAGAILMWAGTHSDGSQWFRPLGGGINFGETGAVAVARELMEEVGEAVVDINLLGVLEDIYVAGSELVHEIVLVYRASWARPDVEVVQWREAGAAPRLRWLELDELPTLRIYPPGLVELIGKSP